MRLTERQHSECKIKCHRGVCCCFFFCLLLLSYGTYCRSAKACSAHFDRPHNCIFAMCVFCMTTDAPHGGGFWCLFTYTTSVCFSFIHLLCLSLFYGISSIGIIINSNQRDNTAQQVMIHHSARFALWDSRCDAPQRRPPIAPSAITLNRETRDPAQGFTVNGKAFIQLYGACRTCRERIELRDSLYVCLNMHTIANTPAHWHVMSSFALSCFGFGMKPSVANDYQSDCDGWHMADVVFTACHSRCAARSK